MKIETFFDSKRTKTATFVITDTKTNRCAIIDPVLDYDQVRGAVYTESIDKVIKFITINDLKLEWILETHIHADHLTASHYIKEKIGGKTGIGNGIIKVLEYWKPIFGDDDIQSDGSQFDQLFKDGDTFKIGSMQVNVIHTPGHTPACVSYHVDGHLFSGDTIFSPSLGTARTDFPGGSSQELFESIQKIYSLPNDTKICLGHDYPSKDSEPFVITTIEHQKQSNVSINQNTKKEDYIERMKTKQINLQPPQLILPSLQVNLRAGRLPKYIKIPVNVL